MGVKGVYSSIPTTKDEVYSFCLRSSQAYAKPEKLDRLLSATRNGKNTF